MQTKIIDFGLAVAIYFSNKKTGKKEGFLNPISKVNIPLSTYHVDFIGPLPSTNKSYQHVLTVVDAFTKFTWLYPVKTVSAENALEKLKLQQKTFGNPVRIITDRGSAFTSKLFNDYCTEENIQHLQIATGIPRGNGQVERI
ncbi:transposon Tf2-6 polyprotein [Trichonephila inaurata madagascariensis]|uniref:Transposon Tf2-6 polyprotein n=1 Tax=Trichonephila inaurata madagascariensis TaxID=2747483 RepID=A0A8X6YJV8_9ARAC|nr:transposon Tf2-6 polyprotein [Trichonephila inaurata madagascariensis]